MKLISGAESQQFSVSWLENVPQEWIRGKLSFCEQGLVVAHKFLQPASEVNASNGGSEHVVILNLSKNNQRQIVRIDEYEYDNSNTSGQVFLVPAHASLFHRWECNSAEETVGFYINPQRFQQIAAENHCLYPERIQLYPILPTHDARLVEIALLFCTEMYNKELGSKLYTESLANLFLIHLLRHHCTQTPVFRAYDTGLSHQQLRQTFDFIHEHLSDEFKLQDLANLLGMSQYYFCRLFKQSAGLSPYQYILQQRVESAKRLLKQSERSIAQIALECGFTNQSQLTQHFRRFTGTTPRVYRKS